MVTSFDRFYKSSKYPFIKLLLRNPQARLGVNGIEEIKEHQWLADVEWERIEQKKLKAPFKPIVL